MPEKRFIADSMLGTLARWLRTLGWDVEYERAIEDGELLKRAVVEDRIVLTRDTLLMKRRGARGRAFFLAPDDLPSQLKEVSREFGMDWSGFLTRCLRCNRALSPMKKEDVAGKVPPYVFETQKEFSLCLSCKRIYWAGTHKKKMREEIEKMLG